MSYVLLRFDPPKLVDTLLPELSLVIFQSENDIEVLSQKLIRESLKSLENMTKDHLIAQYSRIVLNHDCTIVKCKRAIKSDKTLVEYYQDQYLGCIEKSIDKATTVDILEKHERLRMHRYFLTLLRPSNYDQGIYLRDLRLSESETDEWFRLLDDSLAPAMNWLKQKSDFIEQAVANAPVLLRRNF